MIDPGAGPASMRSPGLPAPPDVAFRELTASDEDRVLVRRFYDEVYTAEFPDPDERESLANIERYLELKQAGWYGDNAYHVVVVECGEGIAGGAIADYLADPNAGAIEFLVVSPAWRGHGLGRRLLDHTEASIAADARRAGRPQADWIVAEINDPFRIDLAADNLDPFVRARIWGEWGYRKLDFPYVQPALSEDQQPVHHLLLAVKPLTGDYQDRLPSAGVLDTLREYMRWAMRIPEPKVNPEYGAMAAHLATRPHVPSIPLERYVGRDDSIPLVIDEVVGEGPDLDGVLAVYADAFPPGATALPASALRRAVATRLARTDAAHHHLWALREAPGAAVAGMTSFFSGPGAGFGGYVALGDPLRGRGRLRSVVARIEEQMRRDRTGARGWLIECEPASQALRVFGHVGFREIALDYRQPPLPGQPGGGGGDSPRLSLAYKEFGATYEAPALTRDELSAALRWVFRVVYDVAEPERSPWLRDVDAQMKAWPSDGVEWLS